MVSVLIKRCNAVAVMGTLSRATAKEETLLTAQLSMQSNVDVPIKTGKIMIRKQPNL